MNFFDDVDMTDLDDDLALAEEDFDAWMDKMLS